MDGRKSEISFFGGGPFDFSWVDLVNSLFFLSWFGELCLKNHFPAG